MANVSVYNMEGSAVGSVELSDIVFGAEIKEQLVHQAVVTYLANQRQGTQSALTRSEVSGGGRKPWRQKGTGHARQGSIRAPQWTGGGVVFAPKPRDYRMAIPKSMKRVAMMSALSSKVQEGQMLVVEDLAFDSIKTKNVVNMLNAMEAKKTLIVTAESNEVVYKSARNIEGVAVIPANNINVYDLLKFEKVVMTKDAVSKIEEVYA